jgi:hypothetical protein
MTRSWSVLLVWLLGVAGPIAQAPQRPSEQLDVSGEWQLNESLSDDLPLLPGEALAVARASGTVRAGTRVARSARGPDPRRLSGVRQVLRSDLAAEHLKIVRTGGSMTLTYRDGGTLSIVPDGRTIEAERNGIRFTVVAHWVPPLLTIERAYEDGTLLTETFATFDSPRQLVATSTIQNSHTQEAITFQRVFEAAADGDR